MRDRVRYEDGDEVEREVVVHPGAVACSRTTPSRIWMVRQPRESVGEAELLELPAGKLDGEGEPAGVRSARATRGDRQVRGQLADLKRFYTSPGFTSEEVHAFLATDLATTGAEPRRGSGSTSYPSRSPRSTR